MWEQHNKALFDTTSSQKLLGLDKMKEEVKTQLNLGIECLMTRDEKA